MVDQQDDARSPLTLDLGILRVRIASSIRWRSSGWRAET
jgi:hypothetical protein